MPDFPTVAPEPTQLPTGFTAHIANIGIKDGTTDFLVVASSVPASAAAVFTRSRFAGPSVTLSRRQVADGRLQAAVVISKNVIGAPAFTRSTSASSSASSASSIVAPAMRMRSLKRTRCGLVYALTRSPAASAMARR